MNIHNNFLDYLSCSFRLLLEGKNKEEWVSIVSNNGNNLKRLTNLFVQIINRTPWQINSDCKNLANSILKSLDHHQGSIASKVPAKKIQNFERAKRIFRGEQDSTLQAQYIDTNLRMNMLRVLEVVKERQCTISDDELKDLGDEFYPLLKGKNQSEWVNIVSNYGNQMDRGIRFFTAIIERTNWKENPALWLQAAAIFEIIGAKKRIYQGFSNKFRDLSALSLDFLQTIPEKFSSAPKSNIPPVQPHLHVTPSQDPSQLSEEDQIRIATEQSLKDVQKKTEEKGKEKEENVEQSKEFLEFVEKQLPDLGNMSISQALMQYREFLVEAFLSTGREVRNDPADNDISLGAGIQNGGNSCYLNSVIQSLRILPGFYQAIKAMNATLNENERELRNKLVNIINILEGLNGVKKRTVTQNEINELRNHLFTMGFAAYANLDRERQIDAPECLQFILDALNFPKTKFILSSHSEEADIAEEVIEEYYLPVGIGSVGQESDIDTLLTQNIVDVQLKDDQPRPIRAMKCVSLDPSSIPQSFVVNLARFVYGGTKEDFVQHKLKTKILPSETIELPLHGTFGHVKYRLQSIIVHHGDSTGGGHYYAYRTINGLKEMMRFNDNAVKKTVQPERDKIGEALNDPTILDDIYHNGYVFIYTIEQ